MPLVELSDAQMDIPIHYGIARFRLRAVYKGWGKRIGQWSGIRVISYWGMGRIENWTRSDWLRARAKITGRNSHSVFGPSWTDLRSQDPRRRPGYACGFVPSDRPNPTQIRARIAGGYFCASPDGKGAFLRRDAEPSLYQRFSLECGTARYRFFAEQNWGGARFRAAAAQSGSSRFRTPMPARRVAGVRSLCGINF